MSQTFQAAATTVPAPSPYPIRNCPSPPSCRTVRACTAGKCRPPTTITRPIASAANSPATIQYLQDNPNNLGNILLGRIAGDVDFEVQGASKVIGPASSR